MCKRQNMAKGWWSVNHGVFSVFSTERGDWWKQCTPILKTAALRWGFPDPVPPSHQKKLLMLSFQPHKICSTHPPSCSALFPLRVKSLWLNLRWYAKHLFVCEEIPSEAFSHRFLWGTCTDMPGILSWTALLPETRLPCPKPLCGFKQRSLCLNTSERQNHSYR